jgi:hypothetical protein
MSLDTARARTLARSWGKCEGCGKFGLHLDAHHRQARGAGGVHGEAAEVSNDPRNMLALCRTCHDETEHAQTWDLTETTGWRIPHFVDDPHGVPALIHTVNGYGWWLLTQDDGYRWIDWTTDQRISYAARGGSTTTGKWAPTPTDPSSATWMRYGKPST